MQKKIILIAVFSVFMFYGCLTIDPPKKLLIVVNNTNEAVYVFHTCLDSIPPSPALNLFEMDNNHTNQIERCYGVCTDFYSPDYRINAYSCSEIGVPITQSTFTKCPDGKLKFYFITESCMKGNNWQEISKNQLYEDKKYFSYDELRKLDWIIKYP